MKIAVIAFREKIACNLKWLRGVEAFNPSLFVRGFPYLLMQLAILAIGSVEWLKQNQLWWVWGKVGGMLFIASQKLIIEFDFVGSAL
jgi:hypothetical protein